MSGGRIKLVLFLVGAVVLALIAVLVFSDFRPWRSHDRYNVRFKGSVTGLRPGASVELWGMTIGKVDSITLDRDHPRPARVVIKVDRDVRIPVGGKAYLEMQGLTGVKYLDIRGGELDGPSVVPGGDIPGTQSDLSVILERLAALAPRLHELVDSFEVTAKNLSAFTGKTNQERVARFLDTAAQAASGAREAIGDYRTLARQLRERSTAILRTIETATARLPALSAAGKATMADAREAARSLRLTATRIAGTTAHGARELLAAFEQLRYTIADIRRLVREIEVNPRRLFLGKPARERSVE